MNLNFPKLININNIPDERGCIYFLDDREYNFEFKRIYYLTSKDVNVVRGDHAHLDLKQIFICIHGSCEIFFDNSIKKETFLLSSKAEGIIVPPKVWREVRKMTNDCVLLVLASSYYDENDYFRSYQDYIDYMKV